MRPLASVLMLAWILLAGVDLSGGTTVCITRCSPDGTTCTIVCV
jgi:hypothetical protein